MHLLNWLESVFNHQNDHRRHIETITMMMHDNNDHNKNSYIISSETVNINGLYLSLSLILFALIVFGRMCVRLDP